MLKKYNYLATGWAEFRTQHDMPLWFTMVVYIRNISILKYYIFFLTVIRFKVMQWENAKIRLWLYERGLQEKDIPKK